MSQDQPELVEPTTPAQHREKPKIGDTMQIMTEDGMTTVVVDAVIDHQDGSYECTVRPVP